MITISATINVGFYINSGTVLRTAGPLALFLSFTILTLLAWGVMQCITEMLAIWPVPGALVEFVRVFVDEDLAFTVGALYWSVHLKAYNLCYSISDLCSNKTINLLKVRIFHNICCYHHGYRWRSSFLGYSQRNRRNHLVWSCSCCSDLHQWLGC